MKGWRSLLGYSIAVVLATAVFFSLSILGRRFRQWTLYDEARVEAQIERRVRTLEERIEKLERR